MEDSSLGKAGEESRGELPPCLWRGSQAQQGGQALLVVLEDLAYPFARLAKAGSVSRQHFIDGQRRHPPQRRQVVVQRIGAGLRMEPDVGADLEQQMVSRKQQLAGWPVESTVFRCVAGRPDHNQIV